MAKNQQLQASDYAQPVQQGMLDIPAGIGDAAPDGGQQGEGTPSIADGQTDPNQSPDLEQQQVVDQQGVEGGQDDGQQEPSDERYEKLQEQMQQLTTTVTQLAGAVNAQVQMQQRATQKPMAPPPIPTVPELADDLPPRQVAQEAVKTTMNEVYRHLNAIGSGFGQAIARQSEVMEILMDGMNNPILNQARQLTAKNPQMSLREAVELVSDQAAKSQISQKDQVIRQQGQKLQQYQKRDAKFVGRAKQQSQPPVNRQAVEGAQYMTNYDAYQASMRELGIKT